MQDTCILVLVVVRSKRDGSMKAQFTELHAGTWCLRDPEQSVHGF